MPLERLGKYEILGELGRGAFGTVYRARDPKINRFVALKTLNRSVSENPSLLERFYREAQSAGSLQHPNIVTIFDMGEDAGTPFIAMELVDGSNLEHFISHRTEMVLSLKMAYAVQACRAFDYAHKRGIVHRDIKPANVMLNKEGVVKVVDFGIARVLETSKTQTGTLIGTFSYMPPELYHGEHATERSDIWSFGVLLYELMAYQTPFTGESPASLMQNICFKEPLPLSQLVPECPPDLEAVVHRTLRKPEAERFQSMEDLLLEFEPICRRLQAESVAAIVDRVQGRMADEDIAEARELLRQALQVDPYNLQARSLMEKVNSEARRLSVRGKAEALVEKSRLLLANRKLQEAGAEIENALRLDSRFAPALEMRELIHTETTRRQELSELLQSAKQRLVGGLPDEAEALLLKIQQISPSNKELTALRQQLQEEKERRRTRSQLLEGLKQARLLWTQQSFRECVDLLTGLQKRFPDEDEIASLLQTALEDEAEQKKHDTLAQARILLGARRYEECIELLIQLSQQFPHEEEIDRLLRSAVEDQTEQAKQEGLTESRKLIADRSYQESARVLADLQKAFPEDEEIARLLVSVREGQSERSKQERLAEARNLLSARRNLECIGILLRLHMEFPSDAEIETLLETAQQDQDEQTKQKMMMRARKLLSLRRHAECLELVDKLQKQYPGDEEVLRLLESVRNDEADHARQQRLAEARRLMAARRYDECQALLDDIRHQFPADEEVEKLRAAMQREQAGEQKQEKLQSARSLLAARDYERCFAVLSGLESQFSGDSEVIRLLDTAHEMQTQQEKRESFAQARKLLSARSYDECLNLLTGLRQKLPEDEEVGRLLETTRREQAEYDRKQKLAEARKLLAGQKFASALEALEPLLAEDNPDSSVLKLRDLIQREQEKQVTSEVLRRESKALRKLVSDKAYAEASHRAEELLKQFPNDPDLKRLAEFARREQSQVDAQLRSQTVLQEVRELLKANRFAQAANAARAALVSFPGNPDLRSLLKQAEAGAKKETVQQAPQPPPAAASVAAAASAAKIVSPPVQRESVAQPDAPSAAISPEWSEDTLRAAERHLAAFIGPMAKIMVKKAAAKASSLDELYYILAAGLKSESDRRDFLAKHSDRPRPPEAILPAGDPAQSAIMAPEVTPEVVQKATRLLGHYLGPIALLYARQAARRADSLKSFYLLLAEELQSTTERASFLRDAGVPDSAAR